MTRLPKLRLMDSSIVPQFLKPTLKHGLHGHVGKNYHFISISIRLTPYDATDMSAGHIRVKKTLNETGVLEI